MTELMQDMCGHRLIGNGRRDVAAQVPAGSSLRRVENKKGGGRREGGRDEVEAGGGEDRV